MYNEQFAFRLVMPMKKKKRGDPDMLKRREERKRRKLTREISEHLVHAKTLKPVDELALDIRLRRKIPYDWSAYNSIGPSLS